MRENLHMGLGRNAIPTFLQYLVTSIKTQELEIKKVDFMYVIHV